MKWLGMDFDELYYQSKRFDLYREYAEKLLKEEKAYKDGDAIILKMPEKEVVIYDLIRGKIVFDTKTLKDQVLMKSDGSPAYSFSCVMDDALMEISCVIRGEDHISNTPKQIIIYEALGFKVPKFAHLPLILGEDGARLSKRTGAVAVSDYRKQGFLNDALVNYLMLLGWSPKNNQEMFTLSSAVKKFSIKQVNKSAAVFSMDKLRWLNSQYLKNMKVDELSELLWPLLKENNFVKENQTQKDIEHIVKLYKGRLSVLNDFMDWTDFVFLDHIKIDEDIKKQHLSKDLSKEFSALADRLEKLDAFNVSSTETAFRSLVDELNIKASDLVHPVRVVLTGKAVGPGLFDTMVVLGKEKVVKRLRGVK